MLMYLLVDPKPYKYIQPWAAGDVPSTKGRGLQKGRNPAKWDHYPIMENQMEKKLKNEMGTVIILGYIKTSNPVVLENPPSVTAHWHIIHSKTSFRVFGSFHE